jgi:hypothetical protein
LKSLEATKISIPANVRSEIKQQGICIFARFIFSKSLPFQRKIKVMSVHILGVAVSTVLVFSTLSELELWTF